jgi:oxygen-independent coproporphyrinogen-3 oxidase
MKSSVWTLVDSALEVNAQGNHQGDGEVTAAYVHIPFCHRRCFYCDFPVKVVGDSRDGGNFAMIDDYVNQVNREIKLTAHTQVNSTVNASKNSRINSRYKPLETIFFGGGTPSLLTVSQLGSILNTLSQHFGFASGIEISLEIDPGTFNGAKLEGFQGLGINRFSLGVQAFQDSLLQQMGRRHRLHHVYEAIDLLHRAQVSHWSLDLISGVPSQTLLDWDNSLTQALDAQPPHLSVYDLVLEPQTVFARRADQGQLPLPPEELTAQMYRLSQQRLTQAGYDHYEISNYAKPGYPCRHNQVYWRNQPYYGFGMGATSYLDGRRVPRPRVMQDYYQWLNEYEVQGAAIWANYPTDTVQDRFWDTLMLGLRRREGVDFNSLPLDFASYLPELYRALAPYEAQGWICWIPGDPHPRLQLQDPEGFLFSNQVLSTLFNF